jgi:hypothetical protein
LMMMKLFYPRFVSQTRRLFMWMGALLVEFGDLSNPMKLMSTFVVLQKWMFGVGCSVIVL